MHITSTKQVRCLIESDKIQPGVVVLCPEGVFEVTEVNLDAFIPIDAVELIYDDGAHEYNFGSIHRWTLADMIGKDVLTA